MGDGEHLVVQQGTDASVFALTREISRVGRSRAADLCLDDAAVSRRHALVVRREGVTRVVNDRSLNGILLNGARVEDAVLTDGDEITIGRVRLRYVAGAPAETRGRPDSGTGAAKRSLAPA